MFGGFADNVYAGFGALFMLPFSVGAIFTVSHGRYSPVGCLVPPVALGFAAWVLVQLGLEGMVCVAMVMPFWFIAALGGGAVALFWRYAASRGGDEASEPGNRANVIALAALPFAMIYAEEMAPPAWQDEYVTRSIELSAPASEVWPMLASIPDIDPVEGTNTFTHDWLGIPRPSDAQLVERDGELVRKARWGEHVQFEEIVTEIRPGESMNWRFAFPDTSVQDHTDRHVSPDGEMLKIVGGGYRLTPMADGKTRLTLTTHYRMRSRLSWYFGWWGDQMLGDVERNVLAIIEHRVTA